MKIIARIIIITFIINVAGDFILIPALGGQGAALAYSSAIISQTLLYANATKQEDLKPSFSPLLKAFTCYLVAYCSAYFVFERSFVQIAIALALYAVLILFSGLIQKSDFALLKSTLGSS